MLAIQSRKNIIAGRDVAATVSANLYDVTFHEALDSILRAATWYIEEGNFIYVHPLQEIESIKSAAVQVETRIFNSFYISANDANDVVKLLLSSVGESVLMVSSTAPSILIQATMGPTHGPIRPC